VYLVFPRREEVRALWRAEGEVRGLSWAPDGTTFALTTGSRVVVLERDGSLLRQLRATGAAFLRDGRLAVSRADGIYLVAGSRLRRLASRQELERVAGFRARREFSASHDPRGFTRGHGHGAVALTLWSAGRSWKSVWKSVVLVVTAAGRVVRASPAYLPGRRRRGCRLRLVLVARRAGNLRSGRSRWPAGAAPARPARSLPRRLERGAWTSARVLRVAVPPGAPIALRQARLGYRREDSAPRQRDDRHAGRQARRPRSGRQRSPGFPASVGTPPPLVARSDRYGRRVRHSLAVDDRRDAP
jgi:hypothetical protein